MPIYEFACADCGATFEKRVSFSATTTPPCDSCHGDNVHRQLSAPAIHFKGSGWYITDSKKATNGSSKETTAKKETETTSESGSKASSETSSAATSESKASSEPSKSTNSEKATAAA
jgi:putative FmdB family regulatory protein